MLTANTSTIITKKRNLGCNKNISSDAAQTILVEECNLLLAVPVFKVLNQTYTLPKIKMSEGGPIKWSTASVLKQSAYM